MRKTTVVPITDEGRDKGKRFLITEMSAMSAEKWATRGFLALAHAGVEVPANLSGMGLAGFAALGLQALNNLRFEDAEPLLDEMMACVQIVRDPKVPDVAMPLMPDDIEEVATIARLRAEVFSLHVGFSLADALSKLKAPAI